MPLRIDDGILITAEFLPEHLETPAPAPPQGILDIDNIPQTRAAWCYAACAEMILGYYGKNKSQCEIAGIVKAATCCPPANAEPVCLASGCEDNDFVRMFNESGLISNLLEFLNGPLGLNDLQAEILDRKPVEAIIKWRKVDSSHAVVITAFIGDMFFVNDPLEIYGGWSNYDFIRNGFGLGQWDRTCVFPNP